MSGKRPEGRSPEANILASPKYSKTLPLRSLRAAPFRLRNRKAARAPCTTIAVLPRTAHRRGRFRKERKPQPDRRARLRSGKRTGLPHRSGDRRTTGSDPRDAVRPPRPARRTPETSRRNVLRQCLFTNTRNDFRSRPKRGRRIERGKRPDAPPAQTSGRTETPRHRHAEPLRGKGPRPMHKTGTRPADGLPLRRTSTRTATGEGAWPDVRRSSPDRHPVKTTFLPHPRDKREVRKERRPSRGKFPSGRSPVTAPR